MNEHPNARQVGGTHYQSSSQHWDFVLRHRLDYLRGQASKYITRARKKNGKQDYEKALHYAQKLLTPEATFVRSRVPFVDEGEIKQFAEANQLTVTETMMMCALCSSDEADLHLLCRMLTETVENYPRHWLEADTPFPASDAGESPQPHGYVDQG